MLYFWLSPDPKVKSQIDSLYMAKKSDVPFQAALHQRQHREEYWRLLSQWKWYQDYTDNYYGECVDDDWPARLLPDSGLYVVKKQGELYAMGKNTGGSVEWLMYGCTGSELRKVLADFPCSLATFLRNPDSVEFRRKTLHLAVFEGEAEESLVLELGLPSGRSIISCASGGEVTAVLFSDEHGYAIETSLPLVSDLTLDLTARTISFPPLQFTAPWYLIEEKTASARRVLIQLLAESRTPNPVALVDSLLNLGGWL